MCKILHIETATEVCSVSIAENGKLIGLKETHEGRSHAGVLATFIRDIMEETKTDIYRLDAVSVSKGPGSYTGLRIGVSVAKGLCYGAGLPLIGINTLEGMCNGLLNRLHEKGEKLNSSYLLVPMIDARRMEVYTAIYNTEGKSIKETHALIVNETTFDSQLANHCICFFGSGADKLTHTIVHPNARFIMNFRTSAKDMISLALEAFQQGRFEDMAYFEPYYLKDFITTIPKKKF
jgi:tRNA threonylcarbamoyladenosine biosynthesis protein TsaB